MIKNIIVINDFNYIQGGASKVAIETANELKINYPNSNVYFFSAVYEQNNLLNKDVIQVSTFQEENLKSKHKICSALNGIYNRKAKKKLDALLEELDPKSTIIHIHGWTKALSSSIFKSIQKKKFKYVLTLHDYFSICPNGGVFNYKKNRICKNKSMSFNCLMCNCDSRNYAFKLYRYIRQIVQNKYINKKKKINAIYISEFSKKVIESKKNNLFKYFYVKNPIDFDIESTKVSINNNQYYLYVGRVSKEKGVECFCKTIEENNLKGIVVGDGPEKKSLERKYKKVKFVGWKNSSQVKDYMKKSRCLIFPSKWYEGAPLTPLEAMQYGIPIIMSNKCSGSEYICSNNGLIFNPDEENDLIDKINKINSNILEFNSGSYEYINRIKNYRYIEKLYNVYLQIMEE